MNLVNKRIEAFVIDMIVSFIASSLFFLISVFLANSMLWMSFALAIIYSFLFCKDVNDGKSLGKRKVGLCILSEKSESVPSTMRLILRNIFYILWPIELVLFFCNSGKRLGDLVMQTKVVSCNKEPDVTFRLTRKYICCVLITTFLLFMLFFSVGKFIYELSPAMRLLYS